jgi:hypothetical protein
MPAVCDMEALAPSPVRPTLKASRGFSTFDATSISLRPFLTFSSYRPIAFVVSSQLKYSRWNFKSADYNNRFWIKKYIHI